MVLEAFRRCIFKEIRLNQARFTKEKLNYSIILHQKLHLYELLDDQRPLSIYYNPFASVYYDPIQEFISGVQRLIAGTMRMLEDAIIENNAMLMALFDASFNALCSWLCEELKQRIHDWFYNYIRELRKQREHRF